MKRPGSPALFAIVIAAMLVIGWTGDHNSCLRQIPIRREINQRHANELLLARTLRLPVLAEHSHRVRLPSCDKLFPDR